MPRALSSPPAGTPAEPTVSVSEALGLPADWNMRDAIAGVPGKEAPQVQTQEEPKLPGGDAPASPAAGEEPAAAPAEGAKPEPAAAAPAKGAKPVVPAKPTAAAPAKVEIPAVAPKIKVGDKEYTQEELAEALKKSAAPAAAAEPVKSVAEEPKAKTADEVAAERAEIRKNDSAWIAKLAPELPVPEVTEAQLDTMLNGGKEGVATFKALLQQAQATAILMSRKSMYAELQPVLDDFRGQLTPIVQSQAEAANEREWQNYITAYPEHKDDKDLVNNATLALVQNQADRMRTLSMKEFQAEVHNQVEIFKNRFAPSKIKIGDKEFTREELEALVAGTPAKPAAAPGAKPAAAAVGAPPARAAAPARAVVKPPGANLPSATPGKETKGKSGDSSIIESLW